MSQSRAGPEHHGSTDCSREKGGRIGGGEGEREGRSRRGEEGGREEDTQSPYSCQDAIC